MRILSGGRTPCIDGGPVTQPVAHIGFCIVEVVVDAANTGRHLCGTHIHRIGRTGGSGHGNDVVHEIGCTLIVVVHVDSVAALHQDGVVVDIHIAVSHIHAITTIVRILRSDDLVVDEKTAGTGVVQVHIIEIVVHVLSREIIQVVTVPLHHIHIGVIEIVVHVVVVVLAPSPEGVVAYTFEMVVIEVVAIIVGAIHQVAVEHEVAAVVGSAVASVEVDTVVSAHKLVLDKADILAGNGG